eukprot:jgi/Phyca11/112758/e_gw1.22.548.1
MGREDFPPPFAVTAASILTKLDIGALRRDFERLSVDDLAALASFPVEPHELIGRVVAVAHCLLLSLAPEHTSLELRAPPWPILRLQLLGNTTKIWRKLRKRAWQLENGVKMLSKYDRSVTRSVGGLLSLLLRFTEEVASPSSENHKCPTSC